MLGLIESRDGGETWEPLSLLGKVDFHALRVRGRRVVGYDATSGRVMVSDEGGRTWLSRQPPEPLIDLVVDPTSADRFLTAGESRLDGGRRWQGRGEIGGRAAALLAVTAEALYAATHDGVIKRSSDGGLRWKTRSRP